MRSVLNDASGASIVSSTATPRPKVGASSAGTLPPYAPGSPNSSIAGRALNALGARTGGTIDAGIAEMFKFESGLPSQSHKANPALEEPSQGTSSSVF